MKNLNKLAEEVQDLSTYIKTLDNQISHIQDARAMFFTQRNKIVYRAFAEIEDKTPVNIENEKKKWCRKASLLLKTAKKYQMIAIAKNLTQEH